MFNTQLGTDPTRLSNLSLTVDNCFIYSESIEITARSLVFSRNNLGLVCSPLTIPDSLIINVSGSDGAHSDIVLSRTWSLGKDGQLGGKVWLYIEQMRDELIEGIKIRANRGHGGARGDTADLRAGGAQGGNGGAEGKLQPQCGANLQRIDLEQVCQHILWKCRWLTHSRCPSCSKRCMAYANHSCPENTASCVPPAVSEKWFPPELISDLNTTLGLFQQLSDDLTAVAGALAPVANPTGDTSMPDHSQARLIRCRMLGDHFDIRHKSLSTADQCHGLIRVAFNESH